MEKVAKEAYRILKAKKYNRLVNWGPSKKKNLHR